MPQCPTPDLPVSFCICRIVFGTDLPQEFLPKVPERIGAKAALSLHRRAFGNAEIEKLIRKRAVVPIDIGAVLHPDKFAEGLGQVVYL